MAKRRLKDVKEQGLTTPAPKSVMNLPTGIKSINEETGKAELNLDYFKKINLFIATPCYGGMVTDQYFLSMYRLSQALAMIGVNVRISTLRNESLVPRARNILNAMFMEDESLTHLMFIDADIEFEPESVIRMLSLDKDIVAGAYSKKTINWEQVIRAVQSGHTDPNIVSKFGAEYALNLKFQEGNKIRVENGAIEVLDASTGFLLMKREAIMKIREAHPETKYLNDSNIDPKLYDHCYALFDTMIDPDDRRYLSEDYAFCRRWQKLGGEIWLDPHTALNHIGSYTFEGDISTIFVPA